MILDGGIDPANVARLRSWAERSFADFEAGRSVEPAIMVAPGTDPGPVTLREGTAFAVRTSGSTSGTGRFVELSWASLAASALATTTRLGAGTWLTTLPIEHIAGLQTVLRAVVTGEESRPYRPGEALDGPSYLSLVPRQLARALEDDDHIRSLRRHAAILVGGQATPASLLERGADAGLTLVTTYGMSETCGGCVYDGIPLDGVSVTAEPTVTLSGPMVATGYAGGPAFDGRFASSDLGTMTGGKLRIIGRADDAITTGGLTIFPGHLEHLADRLGVSGYAFGVADETWGQALVFVAESGLDCDLVGAAKAELGREYAPKEIYTLADLGLADVPRASSGKVDRRRLSLLVGELRGTHR